jgi:hypothetical protein
MGADVNVKDWEIITIGRRVLFVALERRMACQSLGKSAQNLSVVVNFMKSASRPVDSCCYL